MLCIRRTLLYLVGLMFLVFVTLPLWSATKTDDEETIRNATNVLQAMLASKDVPTSVLAKADCVIILPSVKKFAVGVGGSGGRGPMLCRSGDGFSGKWSAPAMYTIAGASARSGSRSDIAANLRLPLYYRVYCLRRHKQKNVIGRRTANLKTSTGSRNGVHGGR